MDTTLTTLVLIMLGQMLAVGVVLFLALLVGVAFSEGYKAGRKDAKSKK